MTTTMPVSTLGSAPAGGIALLPHFASGGGWTTEIVLTNSGDAAMAGTVQSVGPGSSSQSAQVLNMVVNGNAGTTFAYTILPRAAVRMVAGNAGSAVQTGSVRITPTGNSSGPSAFAIFSYKPNGVTVTEASVLAATAGTAFQVYTESSATIQSGVAIANPQGTPTIVTLTITKIDGSVALQPATVSVPAGGQIARFVNELFPALPAAFQGVLSVTSPSPIAVSGLRGRYNERGDFLIATTPPVDRSAAPTNSELVFPHIVNGGGYTTQLILLGSSGAGRLWYLTRDGTTLPSGSLASVP